MRRWIRIIAFLVVVVACAGDVAPDGVAPGAATAIELDGQYFSGFETSVFVACTADAAAGRDARMWLEAAPGVDFVERSRVVRPPQGRRGPDWAAPVYIRVIGDLTSYRDPRNAGGYGQLGGYGRSLTVTTVLEMARDRPCGR